MQIVRKDGVKYELTGDDEMRMNKLTRQTRLFAIVAIIACIAALRPAVPRAEDGMWTFDHPPTAAIQQKYGFAVTKEWLDKLRLASVRFNDGGSGSFVSADGLVLTNHHVALGQLQKLSTPQKNYVADGFYAKTRGEEM